MGWSKEKLTEWQLINNAKLKEINDTLRPDSGPKTGKIGIFCFGQIGDLATAMSVLKYRNELWPNKEIIWFANFPNADLLKYAPINEVRPWPWAGNGLPEGSPDFYPLLCDENNRLNKELAKNYDLTADLEDGYFPAPHMVAPEKRVGLDYPNVSRKIFGVDEKAEWHPVLNWHLAEISMKSPPIEGIKVIMLETFCGSGQSLWDDEMNLETMRICREKFNQCTFLFCSHKNVEQFKDEQGVRILAQFTPREIASLTNICDLFIGISSGLSVVTSAWGLKPVPKIQFCGSHICSTQTLATGPFYPIYTDLDGHPRNIEKERELGKIKYYETLKKVIETI